MLFHLAPPLPLSLTFQRHHTNGLADPANLEIERVAVLLTFVSGNGGEKKNKNPTLGVVCLRLLPHGAVTRI